MLDSLVRVSRRVDEKHFVRVTRRHDRKSGPTVPLPSPTSHKLTEPATRHKCQTPHCFPSVPFQQFQVLFHSLFKVLFIFPSRYLFAIGLPSIFSFRWNLPPIRAAIPNNSTLRRKVLAVLCILNGAITLLGVPSQTTSMQISTSTTPSADYIPEGLSLSFSRFTRRY